MRALLARGALALGIAGVCFGVALTVTSRLARPPSLCPGTLTAPDMAAADALPLVRAP